MPGGLGDNTGTFNTVEDMHAPGSNLTQKSEEQHLSDGPGAGFNEPLSLSACISTLISPTVNVHKRKCFSGGLCEF